MLVAAARHARRTLLQPSRRRLAVQAVNLDAWLKEHLGSADRRAAVRGVADRLEDLQGCEYDDQLQEIRLENPEVIWMAGAHDW